MTQMPNVAMTMERYPNKGFPEKVEMISENMPKEGKTRI